jgi:very-short-patch-repair endonuclease
VNLSLRQVCLQYGFNPDHVRELTRLGALTVVQGSTPLRPKYMQEQVERLDRDIHYIVCRACGRWAGQMSTKHLQWCSRISLEDYKARWPDAPLLSGVASNSRVKTPEQRQQQSETLKARFQTPEGEVTRQQIREASRRLMGTSHREVLVARLVEHNRSEAHRKQAAVTARKLRPLVIKWHQENRGASLAGAAHARIYKRDTAMFAARAVVNKTSKLHLGFKTLMEQTGLTGFTTEGKVGPFEVDEAHYETCLAVEVDGCWWHGCATCGHNGVASTLANDKAKNAYLKAAGWCVLRLPGHIVEKDPQTALEQIKEALDNLQRGHAHD